MRKYYSRIIWILGACLMIFTAGYVMHAADEAFAVPRRIIVVPRFVPSGDTVRRLPFGTGQAIHAFLHAMDSLRRDSLGRSFYDSICTACPGLLDSARVAAVFLGDR